MLVGPRKNGGEGGGGGGDEELPNSTPLGPPLKLFRFDCFLIRLEKVHQIWNKLQRVITLR